LRCRTESSGAGRPDDRRRDRVSNGAPGRQEAAAGRGQRFFHRAPGSERTGEREIDQNGKLKAARICALRALSKGGNMRRGFIAGLFISTMMIFAAQAALAAEKPGGTPYDVVITNGKIFDGTGNPWFYADLAIKNGKIVKIGRVDAKSARRVIDAR